MFTQRKHCTGQSGQIYHVDVANLGHNFGPKAGIYLLLRRQGLGGHEVLYVGKTANASERPGPLCNGHHVQASAQKMGLSAIAFMAVAQQWQRDAIERDLIAGLKPPLNVQLRNPFRV
jgi:excinuclease UvrABC nuclease subunit